MIYGVKLIIFYKLLFFFFFIIYNTGCSLNLFEPSESKIQTTFRRKQKKNHLHNSIFVTIRQNKSQRRIHSIVIPYIYIQYMYSNKNQTINANIASNYYITRNDCRKKKLK